MELCPLDWEYLVISEEVSLSGISLLWSITKCWKTQTQQIFISYCSSGWNSSARVPTKSAHLFSVVNYQCSFAFLYHRKGERFLYVLPLLGHKSHFEASTFMNYFFFFNLRSHLQSYRFCQCMDLGKTWRFTILYILIWSWSWRFPDKIDAFIKTKKKEGRAPFCHLKTQKV